MSQCQETTKNIKKVEKPQKPQKTQKIEKTQKSTIFFKFLKKDFPVNFCKTHLMRSDTEIDKNLKISIFLNFVFFKISKFSIFWRSVNFSKRGGKIHKNEPKTDLKPDSKRSNLCKNFKLKKMLKRGGK